jgi:hypothetical protein
MANVSGFSLPCPLAAAPAVLVTQLVTQDADRGRNPLFVVFCLIFAVSPSSPELACVHASPISCPSVFFRTFDIPLTMSNLPNWSRPLPRPLVIPGVMKLKTLADVRAN